MRRMLLIWYLMVVACSTAIAVTIAPPQYDWSVKLREHRFGLLGFENGIGASTVILYGWGDFIVPARFYVVVSVLILIPLVFIVAGCLLWSKKSNSDAWKEK